MLRPYLSGLAWSTWPLLTPPKRALRCFFCIPTKAVSVWGSFLAPPHFDFFIVVQTRVVRPTSLSVLPCFVLFWRCVSEFRLQIRVPLYVARPKFHFGLFLRSRLQSLRQYLSHRRPFFFWLRTALYAPFLWEPV